MFISRKEGRIFIRQDWKEVYEAPVTIRDPDRPLGTHVYTGVDSAPDGSSMRWTAMSMPASTGRRVTAATARRDKAEQPPAPPASGRDGRGRARPHRAAAEGARERIAELLWTGASLIVSDHPRSDEMDNDTDFIVETR